VLTFVDRETPVTDLLTEATDLCIAGDGLARQRYDARPGTTYLIRPDRYIAARWRRFDPAAIMAAIRRATGNG
jgi:3-(3-hydroxy-phenyl)propionate hydroxylase